jgi:FtsP/CotA-like multicopper oxidase with cupredoxin domain
MILVQSLIRKQTMKTSHWIISLLLFLLPLALFGQGSKTIYTCPMHPEVQQAAPGKCPKCGMTLVKKTVRVAPPAAPKPKPRPAPPKPAPVKSKPMPATDPHVGHGTMQSGNQTDANTDRAVTERLENAVTATPNTIDVIKAPPPRIVRYDLYVRDTMVNYTDDKKMRHAIAINGSIPAPTLTFNEGDTAEIWVHNEMHHETSIHWHGLILPNTEDGVSYLTTAPIMGHSSHRFFFPIVQNGTYWYHSHTMTQEQDGMYGAFIINKREEPAMESLPIVLSEWSNLRSREINRSLHNQTDWFGIRKTTVQSYGEAIQNGAFRIKLENEWKRMLAMDVSDVYYDRFFINGTQNNEQPQYKAGDKIRLRVVNGGASSYFWLTWAGGKMTVVSNDGEDVVPVEVDRLIIAVAETYDVIVTIPDDGHSYEFLATPEDRTKSASLWLGSGSKVIAPHLPKLKYFEGMKMMNGMMKMNGDMDMSSMGGMQMTLQAMDMNTVMYPEITGGSSEPYGNTVNEGDGQESAETAEGDNMVGNTDPHAGHNMPNKQQQIVDAQDNKTSDQRGSDTNSKMAGMNHAAHGMQMDGDSTGSMVGMNHGAMMRGGYVDGKWQDMNSGPAGIKTLNYTMLRAPKKTTLPPWPTRTFYFELTGNMNRYVWSLNNRTVSETDVVKIKRGENVRIVMYNNTMMRHPMHLHGHFFRVLNGQGDYAPLKNTLDIMPMETDTIEFAGTESGDWFFHCHILYHMMSGMGRIMSYENSPPNPQIPNVRLAHRKLFQDDRKFYGSANIGLESNGSDGEIRYANTRWLAATEWRLGLRPEHGYESETIIGRYLGKMQWWMPFIGFDYHYNSRVKRPGEPGYQPDRNLFGQESNQSNRHTFIAGVRYTLPLLFIAEARVDGAGKFRVQLMREDIPISSRLRLNLMANTDKEYMAGFRYVLNKYLSLSTHYDSDMGLGAGVTVTY